MDLRRDDDTSSYVATEDDHQVGTIAFRIDNDQIVITHTQTLPEYRGRGVADQLTRYAVDDIRQLGLKIVPQCPFTKAWFDSHPDDRDLLAVV